MKKFVLANEKKKRRLPFEAKLKVKTNFINKKNRRYKYDPKLSPLKRH